MTGQPPASGDKPGDKPGVRRRPAAKEVFGKSLGTPGSGGDRDLIGGGANPTEPAPGRGPAGQLKKARRAGGDTASGPKGTASDAHRVVTGGKAARTDPDTGEKRSRSQRSLEKRENRKDALDRSGALQRAGMSRADLDSLDAKGARLRAREQARRDGRSGAGTAARAVAADANARANQVAAGVLMAVGVSPGGAAKGARWVKRAVLAAVAAFVVFVLVAVAVVGGLIGALTGGRGSGTPFRAETVTADIPPDYFSAYRAAGAEHDVPWELLAGIGEVATNHGSRSPYDDVVRGTPYDLVGGSGGSPQAGPNGIVFPVQDGTWSDTFGAPRSGGRTHQGQDIFAPEGNEVYAVADGVITDSGWGGSLGGLRVWLEAANGDRFYFAHNSVNVAEEGQRVTAGDVIARVGRTGNAQGTPPHVHFEYHPAGGDAVNPAALLTAAQSAAAGGGRGTGTFTPVGGPAQTATGTATTAERVPGTSTWPTVVPGIGGRAAGEGVGPFLLDAGVAAQGGPQDARDQVDVLARTLAAVRDRYGEDTGLSARIDGFTEVVNNLPLRSEDGRVFWGEVLARLPIATGDIGCAVSLDTMAVPEVIARVWRCEAVDRPNLRVVTVGGGEAVGPAAGDILIREALGVAWLWSGWSGDGCDPAAEHAGVFPLSAGDSAGDRCDPVTNIRAAAQVVLDANTTGGTSPARAVAGWDRLGGGWALGPDPAANVAVAGWPDRWAANGRCQSLIDDQIRERWADGNLDGFASFRDGSRDPDTFLDAWTDSGFAAGGCGVGDGPAWREAVGAVVAVWSAVGGDPADPDDGGGDIEELNGFGRWLAAVSLPARAEGGVTPAVERLANPAVRVEVPTGAVSAAVGVAGDDFATQVIETAGCYTGGGCPQGASTPAGGDLVAALVAAGVPQVVAEAYVNAAEMVAAANPSCANFPVELIAGVGFVESGHGTHGGASAAPNGDIRPLIQGPPTRYGRAEGPMQFLTSTWDGYTDQYDLDGNRDGTEDAHNIFDAALGTAHYLCANAAPDSITTPAGQRRGIYAYNHADWYVDDVLAAAARIRSAMDQWLATNGGLATGGGTGIVELPGISPGVAASWAPNVSRMLAAASADGVTLTGSGWRSPERQIELRRQHCGTSHYAIYQAPSSSCSPPTAIPGTSRHERGLAIDFANCSSRSSACYRWLAGNAAAFGVLNLPSEPWHWSVDGG